MAATQMNAVLRHLRRAALTGDVPTLTDGQLLDCFIRSRDDTAFATLLRRHGPMVLGVCRRIAGNVHDADDAFQAAFLVLVRKARSVVPREQVGNWLYGVAYHTALKARTAADRRRGKEKQVTVMPQPESPAKATEPDLLAHLDREVQRLPDKYRLPVVLCELEGRSRKEVAAQLGLPEGTLSSRLAQARKLLARRLGAHGSTLGAAGATVAVSAALFQATVEAATLTAAGQATADVVSANITLLTDGVLKTMYLAKLKLAAGLVLVLGVLGGGLLSGWYGTAAAGETGEAAPPPATDQRTADAIFFGGESKKPDARGNKDAELLQGIWTVTALYHSGGTRELEPQDMAPQLKQPKAEFKGDQFTFGDGIPATFALDATATPKRMNLLSHRPQEDMRTHAIYELNGDDLKICLSEPAGDYPAQFDVQKAANDRSLTLVVLKREKPAPKPSADAKLILGTWQVTMVAHAGSDRPLNKEEVEGIRKRTFTFTADRMETSGGAKGTYALDPGTQPKRLAMALASPTIKEQQFKAIYAIKGDELILCLADPGSNDYPPDFEVEKAKLETHLVRYTLKRVDPAKARLDRVVQDLDAKTAQLQAADLQAQLDAKKASLLQAQAQKALVENQLKQLAAERAVLEAQRNQLQANLDRIQSMIDARDALKNATKGQSNEKALKTLDEMEKLIQQMKKELKDKEDRK